MFIRDSRHATAACANDRTDVRVNAMVPSATFTSQLQRGSLPRLGLLSLALLLLRPQAQ